MATNKKKIQEIKSKLEVIKKINDNPKVSVDNIYEKYISDVGQNVFSGKKLNEFTLKRNSKNDSNDIFSNLLDISDSFIGINKIQNYNTNNVDSEGIRFKSKLKEHAIKAAELTSESAKDIVLNNVKKSFFASDGLCGVNKDMPENSVTLTPKEFDFLNVLTIDPLSNTGKIVYEPENVDTAKIKFDRQLYEQFSSGVTQYQFNSTNNNNLFDMSWDAGSQEYTFTNLTGSTLKVDEFLNDYYSTIELPNKKYIAKTAMLMTIQGDGSDSISFNKSLNKLDRLLKGLFSICGSPNLNNNTSPLDTFNENETDIQYYFNFNNVEGIDIDSEENRLKRVLKFTDCNNFEIPSNPNMIESFVYFSDNKNLNDLIDSTLNRVSTDVYSVANSDIPEDKFLQSLFNDFILNIPKAIVLSVLTPKLFLPIVLIYKSINNTNISADNIMGILHVLYNDIIRGLFWKFIREFWKLIKKELINFISNLVSRIIKNLLKRYRTIITSLIALLTRILEGGMDNCEDLFGSISQTINKALNAPTNVNVPGILLTLSDSLPGYSQDRALMNISERLEASGISLAPIFGEDNDIILLVKAIVDGNIEEMDTNSYVKVSNKQIIIPNYPTPIFIPPGVITNVGKLF